MLHDGANTCFILGSLTAVISVCFFIRQGDPIAMLLYVIYIEPLLIKLERVLSGLQFRRPCPRISPVEAYCDDLNIMTNDLNDFVKIDTQVRRFENYSGAILSRSRKSKVLGFGAWNRKEDWPIPWLDCVQSIKVFGIFICDKYGEMLKLNWDHRLQNFKNVVFSWSSRLLPTIQQKVDVIKTFALSRVYYVASILPLKSSYVKIFETIMRNFIWKGSFSLLKVALDELKNKKLSGGLQLPCLATMGRALLTSQCIRLLKSGYTRYTCHLEYWIGPLLSNILPDMGHGVQSHTDSLYFLTLGDCVASVMVSGFLTSDNLRVITNKQIYDNLADFPLPKVMRDTPEQDFKPIWECLYSSMLNADERQIMFLFIHNKLPVPERLFRIGIKNDPYCLSCSDAIVADREHSFCHCVMTKEAWKWLKAKLVSLCFGSWNTSDIDLLSLFLPRRSFQREMIWLIGKFVNYVWCTVFLQGNPVRTEKLAGYMRAEFKRETKCIGAAKLARALR